MVRAETVVLGSVSLISLIGLFWALSPQMTANVSAVQQWPHVGGTLGVDRNCQYFSVDCEVVRQRPVTFETLLRKWCEKSNAHSLSCSAKCIEQGLRDAQYSCPAASPYLRLLQQLAPQSMATGQVPVDPLGCARLAGEYDFVIEKTLDTEGVLSRSVTTINPCTGVVESAQNRVGAREQPYRVHARNAFGTGDVYGSVTGRLPGQGVIDYVLCSDGRARVTVSGVNVCNTL